MVEISSSGSGGGSGWATAPGYPISRPRDPRPGVPNTPNFPTSCSYCCWNTRMMRPGRGHAAYLARLRAR
jgi:hypothetical protein